MPDDVEIRAIGQTLHLGKAELAATLWQIVPDAIKEPDSEEAKKYSLFRTGLKGFIRPYVGQFLKGLYKRLDATAPTVPRAKDADLLQWLAQTITSVLVEQVAKRKWSVVVEPDREGHYRIVGIATIANDGQGEASTGAGTAEEATR